MRIFIGYRELSNLQLTCLKECYIPTPNQKHLFTKQTNNSNSYVIYIFLRILCYKYKICQIQNSCFFKSLVDGLFFQRKEFEKCIYFVIYLYVFKLVCTRWQNFIRIGITVLHVFEELSVSIVDLTPPTLQIQYCYSLIYLTFESRTQIQDTKGLIAIQTPHCHVQDTSLPYKIPPLQYKTPHCNTRHLFAIQYTSLQYNIPHCK